MAGTQPAFNPGYNADQTPDYGKHQTDSNQAYVGHVGYPSEPTGYPSQPTGYPIAPTGYPPEPAGYNAGPAGHQPPGYNQQAAPPHHMVPMEMDDHHPSNHEEGLFKFTEKSIRLGFIKKVFALLFVQLLITAGLMCIFIFVSPVQRYVSQNDWVYITAVCLTIVCTAVFAFVTKLRKIWPINLICLIIMTLLMSTMLGSIACTMEVDEILIAVGIVCAVVLVCAIMGVQKKFDFTPMVGFLCMFGMILFSFGFLCIFFYNEVMSIVYCSLGALLFALWLLLDIQLILGGKHKLSFDPEDYVGGALTLYVDIIYMLMMIFFIFKAT